MPGDNNSESNTNIPNNSHTEDKGNENKTGNEVKTIPYDRFVEINNKFKGVSSELEAYKKKEKDLEDSKLLDDKKYQELIGKKDEAHKELETKYNQEVLRNKTEKLGYKISGFLSKNNIVDAEDGLKFIKYDDLLDSENAEDEINKRVNELVKNKPYLFKINTNQRSNSENNVAGNQQRGDNTSKGKGGDSIIESLTRKLSIT